MPSLVESAAVRQAVGWSLTLPQIPATAIKTHWSLITGVPSSGKSTVINDLAQLGIPVGHEIATDVITRALAWTDKSGASLSISDILNTQALQDTLFSEEARRLVDLDPEKPIVLDRSIPDVLIFSEGANLDTGNYLWATQRYRFERVIVLEPLPYIENDVRAWTREQLLHLHTATLEMMERLGYTAISIPSADRPERLRMVKEALGMM